MNFYNMKSTIIKNWIDDPEFFVLLVGPMFSVSDSFHCNQTYIIKC